MVEGAPAIAVKPARLLKPELKSEGVKSREVARLGGNIISDELDKVNQEIAGKTDKEKADIVAGHKGKKALKSAENLITKQNDYTNGHNEKHDPDGHPVGDPEHPDNPNNKPMWILYEGKACMITHIRKTLGETMECKIDDQGVRKITTLSTEDVIKAQLVAESENILSLLQGAERDVAEAFLKSIDVRNSTPVDVADSKILEVANARNLPTVESLKKSASVILIDKAIPADATPEVTTQITRENTSNDIRRKQIDNLTGNLADFDQVMDLVRGDPSFQDFPAFIQTAQIRAGQLQSNLDHLKIGQPTMIEGVQTVVTQQHHDKWKFELKAKEAEIKMLNEALKGGGEGLLETSFIRNENGEIKHDRGARMKAYLEQGNIKGIVKEVVEQANEDAQAQGEQALSEEQKEMKKNVIMEALWKYTKIGGGAMALMMVFAMLQGSKQQG